MPDLRLTVLDRLAAVELDELNAHAALLSRVDRKYALDAAGLTRLLADLDDRTRVLEIGGQRTFDYASVYFDTPTRESYRLAAHRRRRRFKVRTRTYVDTGQTWLEVKTRGGRHRTVKSRTEYAGHVPDYLSEDGRAFVTGILDREGIDPAMVDQLEPVLHTAFTRVTLWLPDDGSRTTIDRGLSVGRQRPADVDYPGAVIVETKSGPTPSSVDRLLWSHGIRPSKVSKFAIGMASLDPHLPANRWRRAMRGPLTPRTSQHPHPSERNGR